MHPRLVRQKLLKVFWWLVAGGIVLTAPLYGAAWLNPQSWVQSGIMNILIVTAWAGLGWMVSRRHETYGHLLFVCGLIPFVAYTTGADANLAMQLNLQPSSRIALMGPMQLFLGLLGGVPGVILGLLLTAVSFWGNPLNQLVITGHQLLLFGIFGVFIQRLLKALEQRQDQLEALNQQLETAALTEPITGFRNRRALEQDWDALNKQQTSFAMWDLDGLKRINDSKGHQAGDQFIAAFCQTLKNKSNANALLYRVGGDEFISIHPNIPNLESLIEAVHSEFRTVSVGWVRLSDHDLDAAMLESDALMYKNKVLPETKMVKATHG
jgi:diguanylate cyclase (GGDEF)-like protein